MRVQFLLVACCLPFLTGCQTFSYYSQAVSGQMQILCKERSIQQLLADPQTSSLLKEKLQLVLRVRDFAKVELHLEPNGHYLQYADLQRRFAVWNVYAAPELSLKARTWWYPVVGRLKYRGFFEKDAAFRYAHFLEQEGYDVFVGGVEAYSTLGWFRDPVLNTFVFDDEAELVELLFHELAHQRVFVRGDTDFNEAFATAVAEEGLRRWLDQAGNKEGLEDYLIQRKRKQEFVALLSRARERLREIYGDKAEPGPAKDLVSRNESSASAKRLAKERAFAELRREYEELKAEWGGYDKYDAWFAKSLNNAKLNTVETYYKLVPAFDELLRGQGGDLNKMYEEARRLAAFDKKKRRQRLTELLDRSGKARTISSARKIGVRDRASPAGETALDASDRVAYLALRTIIRLNSSTLSNR